MTTMPDTITGGFDIHLDVYVPAALDAIGGVWVSSPSPPTPRLTGISLPGLQLRFRVLPAG